MNYLISLFCCLTLVPAGVPRAQGQQDAADSSAVVATLSRFLQALRERDSAGMRIQLDPAARMTLLRPARDGDTEVLVLSGSEFIRIATDPTGPPLDEPIRNLRLTIDGPLAAVWAEYQVRANGMVSHCGYDAFHLVKKRGAWRILHVSDSFRREGCGIAW